MSCPFKIYENKLINPSSVPISLSTNNHSIPIPFSPILNIGGTTPPSHSSFLSPPVYKRRPPPFQNVYYPAIGNSFNPNQESRVCKNIYSPTQNMIGRVCTTSGVEEGIDAREGSQGVNGNGEWVRGNQFAWIRKEKPIYQRIMKGERRKENNIIVGNENNYYPIKRRGGIYDKEYPHPGRYMDGYPIWEGFGDMSYMRGIFWVGYIMIVISFMIFMKSRK